MKGILWQSDANLNTFAAHFCGAIESLRYVIEHLGTGEWPAISTRASFGACLTLCLDEKGFSQSYSDNIIAGLSFLQSLANLESLTLEMSANGGYYVGLSQHYKESIPTLRQRDEREVGYRSSPESSGHQGVGW